MRMKILATFDARDYEGTTGIYEKYSIRAIIVRDGSAAGRENIRSPEAGRSRVRIMSRR